jgi:hypothetical protein
MSESGRRWAAGFAVAILALLVALVAYLYPRSPKPHDSESSVEVRAPYISRVDTLCAGAKQQLGRLGAPPQGDPPSYGRWLINTNEILRQMLVEWSNIDFPSKDEERIRRMLELLDRIVFEHNAAAQLLVGGDAEGANDSLARVRDTLSDYRDATRAYGFRACPFI